MIKYPYRYEKFKKTRLDMDEKQGPTKINYNGSKVWWNHDRIIGPQMISSHGWKRWDLNDTTIIMDPL